MVFSFKILITLELISIGSLVTYSYPYYPECSDLDEIQSANYTILNTLNGKVQGRCYNVSTKSSSNEQILNRKVLTWLSIPFAEPPINENRFKKPIEIRSWNHTRDGTQWPNRCIQENGVLASLLTVILDRTIQFNSPKISEDCLYLNIFVPFDAYKKAVIENDQSARKPILVYIHGGSFVIGASSDDVFEPSTFVATKNIIFISFNYRLGALGFLHITNTLATGNQGFLDQHMALKWIYNNAEFFGGDKRRITISGESAGAFSVGYHLAYEPSWPYFNNAILQSGSPLIKTFPIASSETASVRARNVLSLAGCITENRTDEDIIKCGQNLDPLWLFNSSNQYLYTNMHNGNIMAASLAVSVFPLVKDNIVFNQTFEEYFKNNQMKQCDLIVGSTSSESGSFAAFSGYFGYTESEWNHASLNFSLFSTLIRESYEYYPTYPNKANDKFIQSLIEYYVPNEYRKNQNETILIKYLIQIVSDQLFLCPEFDLIEYYDRYHNVYVYSYDHLISTTIYTDLFGVVHEDELPMVFGEPLSIKKQPLNSYNYWTATIYNYSIAERKFSEQIMSYWTNFVTNNNPNLNDDQNVELPCWYQYTKSKISADSVDTTTRCNEKKSGFSYLRLEVDAIENLNGYASNKCQFWRSNSSSSLQNNFSLVLIFLNNIFILIFIKLNFIL